MARVDSPETLGAYVRERRRELGRTQHQLAHDANVSRRWLCDLEAGKATAEIGLVLRTVRALGLSVLLEADRPQPGEVDLDQLLSGLTYSPEQGDG